MLQEIFNQLTQALTSAPYLAISASFVWGILSIILSPCHLASIPLIVGFIGKRRNTTTQQSFVLSLLFATGILITIGLVGVITAGLGRMIGDIGPYGNYAVAVIFFLVGLHLLDVIPMPRSGPAQTKSIGKGRLAVFLLGLIFGIAIGPCTFAYMAPILAITFKIGTTNFLYAVTLLLIYGVGHCSVIVAAGTSTKTVQSYLNWSESSKGTIILKKACGILVLLGGIYLIWIA